jgi:hypothetical protein
LRQANWKWSASRQTLPMSVLPAVADLAERRFDIRQAPVMTLASSK